MALAREVMGGGFSAGQAVALGGGVSSAVTAAGTTQGTATALTTSVVVVTTAAASTGVMLPSMQITDSVYLLNLGANAIQVYPYTGDRINALSTNTGFTLATNTAAKVMKFTSTRCLAFLSA